MFDLPAGVRHRHHDPRYVRALLRDLEELSFEELGVTTRNGHASRAFQSLGRYETLREGSP